MSLEQRNKKVAETFEKYKIGEWGNGVNERRTVSLFIVFILQSQCFDFLCTH